MKELFVPNYTDPDHLEYVKSKMSEYGKLEIPVLRKRDDWYVALEGSHRMRAAFELNLPVSYIDVDPDEITTVDDIFGYEEGMTNGELANIIMDSDCGKYDISGHIPVLLYDRGNEYDPEEE